MSVNRNFTRTLSGANSFTIDNLELASHRNTIRINGNSGNAGDVLGKDENNRLVFQTLAPFVIDPNSIDGTKLTDNISITTTGNYSGNSMELTGNLEVDNNVTILGNLSYAGDLNINDLVVDSLTLDENFEGDGNINLNQHAIVGDYVNLNINGNTGSIVCFQLTSKDSMLVEDTLNVTGLITGGNGLTLTSGDIQLDSGNIDLTSGNIELLGGDIECVDFQATGDITGDGDITIDGDYTSTDGNITLTNGNISVVDNTATNGFFDSISLPKTGSAVITLSSSNGNINTTGNFTTTAGNVETTSGNIFTTNGNIHANNGYVRGDVLRFLTKLQLGDSATPSIFIDNTEINAGTNLITTSHTGSYASNDFALELTEANSHAKIGGNLKVDGTIFGTIVGDVSETHINGQSLRIHDLGDEGGDTGIQVEDGYDIRMYSDAGTTKTIELDSSSGDITITGTLFGNVEGNISEDHINGQSLIIEDLGSAGNTGIEIHDGYDLATYSDGGTTKTFAIDGSNGNYASNSGNILLSNGDLTVDNGDVILNKVGSKPAPEDNTYTDFALDLTDTNTHARIGGNLIVDGTIYGDVVGAITEEIIDAQKINLREATPPSGAFIGMEIFDTASNYGEISMRDSSNNYNFRVYSGGNVDIAGAIVWNGATFNNVNGGNILMNDGVIKSDNTSTSTMDLDFDAGSIGIRNGGTQKLMSISDEFITIKNSTYPTITGTQIRDTFYRLNDSSNNSGNARVIIESTDGISLLTGTNQYNLTLSPAGNISWGNNSSGEIIGRDAGSSSSNDTNTTQMRKIRIDESCFKYDTREIAINKPTSRIERLYNVNSTAWSEINDRLYVKLKTNNMTATNFIVEWSYYAVKDDGSRLWAKLYDIDASSPADADQPTYLNNTKQVLFDGATDLPSQHHATFTMRNVSANVDKNIGVCIWTLHNNKSYIRFFLGPASFTGDPPTGGALSSYAFGGMTLQIKKLYDESANNNTPTGWSSATDTDLLYIRNNPINSPYFYHKEYDPTSSDFDALSTTYQALFYSNVAGTFVADCENIIVELLTYNYTSTSNRWFYLRLVDSSGTEFSAGTNNGGSGTGTRNTERQIHYADETDKQPVLISWKLEGLTIGNTYNLAPQVKTSGTFNYALAGGNYPATLLRAYKLENEEEEDDY